MFTHSGLKALTTNIYKTGAQYGDRCMRQFGETFGSVALEGNVLWGSYPKMIYGKTPMALMNICKELGKDADRMLKEETESMKAYIDYAYEPEKNKFRPMFNDGTDMTNYVIPQYGYYGDAGTIIREVEPYDEQLLAYIRGYNLTEEESFWKFIRNFAMAEGLGDLGSAAMQNVDANLNTECDNSMILMAVLELYNRFPDPDYLELARKIGNNIVNNKFYYGFFVENERSMYCNFNTTYPLALICLEAAINGNFEEMPQYLASLDTLHFVYKFYDGYAERSYSSDVIWSEEFEKVEIKELAFAEKEIAMKAGETASSSVRRLPVDSTGTIVYESSDNSVASVDREGNIYAHAPGTAEIRAFVEGKDLRAVMTVQVSGRKD